MDRAGGPASRTEAQAARRDARGRVVAGVAAAAPVVGAAGPPRRRRRGRRRGRRGDEGGRRRGGVGRRGRSPSSRGRPDTPYLKAIKVGPAAERLRGLPRAAAVVRREPVLLPRLRRRAAAHRQGARPPGALEPRGTADGRCRAAARVRLAARRGRRNSTGRWKCSSGSAACAPRIRSRTATSRSCSPTAWTATGKAADGVRAARLLYDVVVGEWQRFEEVEVIALMELNRLLARLERLDAAVGLQGGLRGRAGSGSCSTSTCAS